MTGSPSPAGSARPISERAFRMLQVAAVLVAALASMATSPAEYPWCVAGSAPFDGQTGVPTDAPLIVVGFDLPDSMPRLGGAAFQLERVGDFTRLPVTVRRVRSATQADGRVFTTWAVEPEAPLAPDTAYMLIGIDLASAESPHFARGSGTASGSLHDGYEWPVVFHAFTTASAPRLIGAISTSDVADAVTVRLLFSEPMDLDSLARHATIVDADDQPLTLMGPPVALDGQPHLVELTVEADAGADPSTWTVQIAGEAMAAAGGLLHGAGRYLPYAGFDPVEPGTAATWRVDGDLDGDDLPSLYPAPAADWIDALVHARPLCEVAE